MYVLFIGIIYNILYIIFDRYSHKHFKASHHKDFVSTSNESLPAIKKTMHARVK